MNNITKAFGHVVSARRDDMKMTQSQVADRANISVRGLQYIEQGKKSPSIRSVSHIARALDMSSAQMLRALAERLDCDQREVIRVL